MLEVDDLILVSVDDHLIEPPDLFVNHLDAKYLDRAPKLLRNDEGNDVWTFGKVVMETAALNAVAGRPKEEYGMEPQSLDEVRPGCYDVHERVKDMDAGGVLASMNFPSFPTFTARTFFSDDVELSTRAGAGLQRLAHRRVVRRPPRPVHPDGRPRHLERRRRPPPRCGARRPRAATRSASPRTRRRSATPASTTTTGTRCGRPASTPAPCCPCTSARRAACRSPPPTRRPT